MSVAGFGNGSLKWLVEILSEILEALALRFSLPSNSRINGSPNAVNKITLALALAEQSYGIVLISLTI